MHQIINLAEASSAPDPLGTCQRKLANRETCKFLFDSELITAPTLSSTSALRTPCECSHKMMIPATHMSPAAWDILFLFASPRATTTRRVATVCKKWMQSRIASNRITWRGNCVTFPHTLSFHGVGSSWDAELYRKVNKIPKSPSA